LSPMIHFYFLNPRMCQLGVRNVGYKTRRNPANLKLNSEIMSGRATPILVGAREPTIPANN
ncbi:hypothetical protein QUB10_23755, partial [Microcoleus sp. B5-D4]|uniref:hypothetical protein n=1 Tax=unclassified Microcoleus TaxID=2642155 RepID=UPI002FD04E56